MTISGTLTFSQSGNCPLRNVDLYGAGVTVSAPVLSAVNNFALELPSPQPTAAPFSAGYNSLTFDSGMSSSYGNASVAWTATIQYQTGGKIPKPPAMPSPSPTPFSTNNADGYSFTLGFGTPVPGALPTPDASFPVAGGKLTITGTYNAGVGAPDDPATNSFETDYMTGILGGICDASITNELSPLYTSENAVCTNQEQPLPCCTGNGTGTCDPPATQDLLALIAVVESSYAQFASATANGIKGLWPNQSDTTPKGQYIGLMMVALQKPQNIFASPMDTAWNWLTNAQVGLDFFNQKLGYVGEILVTETSATYPGLPQLTPSQVEDMALMQYYGAASAKKAGKQYYIVTCVGTGKTKSCSWEENPMYNLKNGKLNYVQKVRAATPPSIPCP